MSTTDTITARPVIITVTTALGADFTTALTTGEAVNLADAIQRHAATLTAGIAADAEREARGHLLHLTRTLARAVAGVTA